MTSIVWPIDIPSIGVMIPMQTETAPPMVGPAYGTTFITPMIRPMKKASCALMPKAIITSDTANINRKLSAKIPRK